MNASDFNIVLPEVALAVYAMGALLFGVYTGSIHMAGGMLVHQLSVLIVILNGMRLLRIPKAAKARAAGAASKAVAA